MIFLPAVVATLYPFVPDTAYQFVGQDLMFLFGYVDNNYRLRFSADSFSTPHDGQFFHQSQITMSLWPPRCRKVNRVRKGRDLHSHVMPAEYKRRQTYSLQFDPLGRSCVGLHNTRLGLNRKALKEKTSTLSSCIRSRPLLSSHPCFSASSFSSSSILHRLFLFVLYRRMEERWSMAGSPLASKRRLYGSKMFKYFRCDRCQQWAASEILGQDAALQFGRLFDSDRSTDRQIDIDAPYNLKTQHVKRFLDISLGAYSRVIYIIVRSITLCI